MAVTEQDNVETAYLVVCGDDGYGSVFPLAAGKTYTLGRAPSNSIVLKDDVCSREHAEIAAHDGRWLLRDLHSANGTHINDIRIESERELEPRDKVQLGRTQLLFVADLGQLPDLPPRGDSAAGDSTVDPTLQDGQLPPTGIQALRVEFWFWLQRHGAILRAPAAYSTAVFPTPGRVQIPETKWFGAMGKCCHYVDALIGACLKRLLPIAGERGVAVVEKIAAGKPLDRLTLGQHTQILEGLDAHISAAFWDAMPHTYEARGGRLLGPSGVAMLHKLSRMRNDFAHGRWQRDQTEKELFAQELPKAVSELCQSMLVYAAMVLEDLAEQGNTQIQPGPSPRSSIVPPGPR